MNTTSTWSQGHNWLYTIDCYCRNILVLWENFEDTKGALRSRKSEDRQYNGQKKKDKRTNSDLRNATQKTKDRTNTKPTKKQEWTEVLRKGRKFLLHIWHPSCYFWD